MSCLYNSAIRAVRVIVTAHEHVITAAVLWVSESQYGAILRLPM